ncbi:MAG: NADP-dependent isocitrate dehydrogenase [Deltaproteobacteria bacterium]|jgi:isocitrate dehydrogenase|nr:NADP-dependent isocitrate dehydrogenase [Deltaproteobacteria bacterium]
MRKTVYFIPGDGIGPEVWAASRPVLDAAAAKSYGNGRSFDWRELLAGEKALAECGELLPEATLEALRGAELAIKGPLSTPVGKGFRSLNVTLRQTLDLYACIRPVRHLKGTPSPVRRPDAVDMVIFRENTEDVYAGIEYEAGGAEAKKLLAFLRDELGARVDMDAAVGIKPMSEKGSKRLIRRAARHALRHKLPALTLMHKGNIMKFTEGGFRRWGYEVMEEEEFAPFVFKEDTAPAPAAGKLAINDVIADALFQSVLLQPERFSVIAAPNLNGDYISDALAAQVGGLGLAPGVNMSDRLAFFEATHGTAPGLAGRDAANPTSLLLSGVLMLEHLGWLEAAGLIRRALDAVMAAGTVTPDLAAQMPGAASTGCRAFGELLLRQVDRLG